MRSDRQTKRLEPVFYGAVFTRKIHRRHTAERPDVAVAAVAVRVLIEKLDRARAHLGIVPDRGNQSFFNVF